MYIIVHGFSSAPESYRINVCINIYRAPQKCLQIVVEHSLAPEGYKISVYINISPASPAPEKCRPINTYLAPEKCTL